QYIHTTKQFQIYNAGISIHPFQFDLKITIEDLEADTFTLTNLTNGSEFKINEPITRGQVIVLDGAMVTRNGLQFLRSTNKEFIELSPKWNDFQMSHDAKITFQFRFYYK